MRYNATTSHVNYNNSNQYRHQLRTIFNMDCSKIDISDEIDDESRDELLYDDNAMNEGMEEIYELTKNNPLFQNLYDLAAAKMFSTDRTIGECVLFSYDNFALFHNCLCVFINTPEKFTEKSNTYLQMLEKIK